MRAAVYIFIANVGETQMPSQPDRSLLVSWSEADYDTPALREELRQEALRGFDGLSSSTEEEVVAAIYALASELEQRYVASLISHCYVT